MENIICWNVRALIGPLSKMMSISLHSNKVGMIGLLETKIKLKNVEHIAARTFPTWNWKHNFDLNAKGRIWLAWNPAVFDVGVLQVTEQLIHYRAHPLSTSKKFCITFIYGFNQEQQRQTL